MQALAWIVDAAELDAVLASAVRFAPHITVVAEAVQAPLAVVAEGKDAASRAALGVKVDTQAYGHSGVAARLRSDQPHAGLARQWFRSPDILALLPFDRPSPGHSYGLVWSVPQDRAQALLAMAPAEFEQALAQATGGEAGSLALEGPRATWPLRLARAATAARAGAAARCRGGGGASAAGLIAGCWNQSRRSTTTSRTAAGRARTRSHRSPLTQV